MNHTEEEIQTIIANTCGTPPEPEKLKYCIWLNESKLDHYTRSPFPRAGKENEQSLDSYRRLIRAAKIELEKIDTQLKIEL